MKLLHKYPDLQGANACCGSICSFEYLLFSNLELSAGLLTTLNAYKRLCVRILACKDIITVCSQTRFCIVSTMALMLQSEDPLLYVMSKNE